MNKYLGLCLSILILNGCNEMSTSNPPNPKKVPYELEAHGDKRIEVKCSRVIIDKGHQDIIDKIELFLIGRNYSMTERDQAPSQKPQKINQH